jgi:hypothetical protein
MEEIKRRTEVIRSFLKGNSSTPYKQTTVESICLQVRKIIELIALASLVANKDVYAAHRSMFAKDFHAKNLLGDIARLNPNFYPRLSKQILDPTGTKVVRVEDIKSGFLTKDDLIKIYERTAGLLHAGNPFGEKKILITF